MSDDIKFGDYATIEQKRFSSENEHYEHKVIGTLKSNYYVDVPVQSPTEEKTHTDIVDVVACITCGVCERTVYRYKASDVKKRIKKMTTSENLRIKAAESMGWTGPWRFGNIHLHGTSPDGFPNRDVPECIDGIIKDLCYKVDTLSTGIKAVRSLINESQGVAGLHLNGDIVEWSELEAGGRSEEWLGDLNYSEDAITEKGELKK